MQTQDQEQVKPKSNRTWLIIGGVILACCCILAIGAVVAGPAIQKTFNEFSRLFGPAGVIAGPAEGGLGDDTLKADVWHSIVNWYVTNENCTYVTNTKIEVTQPLDSTNNVWQEAWTVEACGQTAVLNVKFTPSPKGGTDYDISGFPK